MQKYQDQARTLRGDAINGASITVTTLAGALATLYSDNGVTLQANPIVTGRDGEYAFYAADGRYNISISAPGFAGDLISDYSMGDPLTMVATAAAAGAAASQAIKTQIDHRYRGALTADPATRTDGSANQAGDEYFNTVTSRKMVYRAGGWLDFELSASTSANASEVSRLAAVASATAAATAKTAAEAARDAAAVAGKVYATPVIGLANTSGAGDVNRYFSTPSPDSSASLILWLNSAGVASEVTRYPSSGLSVATTKSAMLLGYSDADFASQVVGSTVPNASEVGDGGKFWGASTTTLSESLLTSFSVRMGTGGNIRLLLVNSANAVIYDKTFTGVSGVNVFPVESAVVPAGTRPYVQQVTGTIKYIASSSIYYSFVTADYNGTLGDTVSPASDSIQVAAEFLFKSVAVSVKADLAAKAARFAGFDTAIDNAGLDVYAGTAPGHVGTTDYTSTTTNSSIAYWSPDVAPAAVDRWLTSLGIRTSIEGQGVLVITNASHVVQSITTVYLDKAGVNLVPLVSPLRVPAGGRAYFRPAGDIMCLGVQGADTKNYFFQTAPVVGNAMTVSANLTPVSIALHFDESYVPDLLAGLGIGGRIVGAVAYVAGMVVTVEGKLLRNGQLSSIATVQTLTATTGSDVRYDVIYLDIEDGTFGVLVGTPRTIDPGEFIPALTNSRHLALFNCRVTATAVDAVGVWHVEDAEARMLASTLEAERRRSRRMLPKTLAKIRKGAALKVLGFGDSIIAIQSSAPSSSVPNGATRDVAAASLASTNHYLRDSIAADVVDAIPLYTAVQLGRVDDGAGAVHTRFGFVWELVTALQATGSAVTYDNFGISGIASASAVNGAVLSAWGLAAVALTPDVVVINFGMNERGVTTTEANLIIIGNAFKAAGIEVIFMGVARPNGSLAGWEYTNRAIERAATFTGSAFIPFLPLYDSRYIGAIGCSTLDSCAANRNNHPGLLEHKAIGRELIKLVLGSA
jgi:lysophospholipase L1-like esterase